MGEPHAHQKSHDHKHLTMRKLVTSARASGDNTGNDVMRCSATACNAEN